MDNDPITPYISDPSLSEIPTPSLNAKKDQLPLWIIGGLVFLALGTTIGVFGAKFFIQPQEISQISTYQECLAAKGSRVQESYPGVCVTVSGQRFTQPVTSPSSTPTSGVPESTNPITDPTADWKTYTANGFTFRYPGDFIVEERDKNFFVITLEKDKLIPQAGISIDAKLLGNFASYDVAVSKTKESLTNITTQELPNGIKISGKVGPGFGENLSINKALLKYKGGALNVETLINEPYSEIFDQILSTFKFLN